jgi:hypothetical protein
MYERRDAENSSRLLTVSSMTHQTYYTCSQGGSASPKTMPTQSPKALADARAALHAQKFGGKAAFAFANPLRTTRST